MQVEFLTKWPVDLSEEERDEWRRRRLIGDSEEGEGVPTQKFVYRPLVLEMDYIEDFNDDDGVHTAVRTASSYFVLKIPFRHFKAIFESMRGTAIKHWKDFKFVEHRHDEFGGEGYSLGFGTDDDE